MACTKTDRLRSRAWLARVLYIYKGMAAGGGGGGGYRTSVTYCKVQHSAAEGHRMLYNDRKWRGIQWIIRPVQITNRILVRSKRINHKQITTNKRTLTPSGEIQFSSAGNFFTYRYTHRKLVNVIRLLGGAPRDSIGPVQMSFIYYLPIFQVLSFAFTGSQGTTTRLVLLRNWHGYGTIVDVFTFVGY